MYVELTWFHADMYFSMHWVKQVCSPEEKVEFGLGMHLWKQCSLIFWGWPHRLAIDRAEARMDKADG